MNPLAEPRSSRPASRTRSVVLVAVGLGLAALAAWEATRGDGGGALAQAWEAAGSAPWTIKAAALALPVANWVLTSLLFLTLTRAHGLVRMKLYMMVGVPDETDEDIDELVLFATELSKIAPLALGIAPFVSKRNTPLDGQPFAGIDVVDRRLDRLRRGLKGKVDLRATSARWAWVEWVLAQGGRAEGRAVMDAAKNGGSFAAWKRAFAALPEHRERRTLAVVA